MNFNQLLYNEEVKILMAAIGGSNSNSILPYIDYEYLKKHPKIIIGFSDTTALLLGIYAKTGLVTFYGPSLVASFGELAPFSDMTFEEFENIICEHVVIPYEYKMPAVWTDEFINWTTQDRSKEGDILLIEDTCKDAFTMEKLFSMLKLAGVFEKIGGIILGKHERFQDGGTGRKPYEILLEVLGETKMPILAEFDCCHTLPMFTMPIGCQVELNATEKKVVLLEASLV